MDAFDTAPPQSQQGSFDLPSALGSPQVITEARYPIRGDELQVY